MSVVHRMTAPAEQWAAGLDELMARLGPRFARSEPRQRARQFLQALLSPVERKNGWQMAQAAGDETPHGVQHLLGRATWEADKVRDDLRDYVVEHFGDPEGVLIVDETGFLKKGAQSVGVQRQYSGTAGRIENCQIGVFLAYHAARGHTFLDRALYLPQCWTDDPERCRAAGVPEDIEFATKPALAQQMLKRALDAGVPARWVAGDSVYGSDSKLRRFLETRRQRYLLGVTSDYTVRPYTAGSLADALPVSAWQRVSAGAGSKGPRWFDWALHLIHTDEAGWGHWLLIRRHVEKPDERAYFRVFAPATTSLEEMAAVAGKRWAIEECFELAKGDCGLDEYEVRSWTGWHRHVTLSLLAHAYVTVVRAHAVTDESLKKRPGRGNGKRI